MMRSGHGAIGKATANGNYFDVRVVIADIVAHVLEAAQRGEIGDGIGEGNLAAEGHACGHAGHVLLGDASIQELFRELFHERRDDTKSQISDDQDDALVLLGQLEEFCDECSSHLQWSNSARASFMSKMG